MTGIYGDVDVCSDAMSSVCSDATPLADVNQIRWGDLDDDDDDDDGTTTIDDTNSVATTHRRRRRRRGRRSSAASALNVADLEAQREDERIAVMQRDAEPIQRDAVTLMDLGLLARAPARENAGMAQPLPPQSQLLMQQSQQFALPDQHSLCMSPSPTSVSSSSVTASWPPSMIDPGASDGLGCQYSQNVAPGYPGYDQLYFVPPEPNLMWPAVKPEDFNPDFNPFLAPASCSKVVGACSPHDAVMPSATGASAPPEVVFSMSPQFLTENEPSADAFRSWLQTSGFPLSRDLLAELQAAAPEVYED